MRPPAVLLLLLLLLLPCCRAARVLGVFPIFSRSHFNVFDPLMVELVSRGHDVVLVSAYPLSTGADYTHIDIQQAKEKFNGSWSLSSFPRLPVPFHNVLMTMSSQVRDNEKIFLLDSVRQLVSSGEQFDVVIVEEFTSDVFAGFAHVFDAPLIVFSSCPPMPWAMDRYGAPASLAFSPHLLSDFTHNMTFLQRSVNVLQVWFAKVYQKLVLNRISQKIAWKHFGQDFPLLEDIVKSCALFLVNSHPTFYGPRPLPPQVVEVGGIHVRASQPLNKELDKWMNESVGVIYFSFGSMLRGATLPAQKVRAFVEVFGKLPYKVLWKWEDDTLDNIPSNVKIMKWLPQRDVLAHPAVKVFISHGGLLGSTEAVVSGVPILGIPMYGDQPNNVAALVDKGVAIHVDYNNITVDSLSWALNLLLSDRSYSANAASLSRRFQDRPMSPLDTAVFWTEYVIRHRGAPHLRSAAVDLAWYQYHLLDVALFCAAALVIVLAAFYYIVRTILKFLGCSSSEKVKTA